MNMFILGLLAGFLVTIMGQGIRLELKQRRDMKKNSVMLIPIHHLNVSKRIINLSKTADIHTVGDLVKYKKRDLLKFRNFGVTSLKQLEKAIEGDLQVTTWDND